MKQLKYAVVLTAGISITVLSLFAVLGACDGDTQSPTETGTIPPSDGTLDDLEIAEGGIGDEIVLTGKEWNDGRSVTFYLLTEDQFHDGRSQRYEQETVRLGDVMPQQDGTVALNFRLEPRYSTPNGHDWIIQPGQKVYIVAVQQSSDGARGSGVGPLTIRP